VRVTDPDYADPSSLNSGYISEIYSWASRLASEARDMGWVTRWYVWPDAVRRIERRLETMRGGVVGLVGRQGVGKSSALQAIYVSRIEAEEKALKHSRTPDNTDSFPGTVLFKWRREPELFKSLLDETHELSRDYEIEYRYAVWKRLLSLLTDLEKREQHGQGTLDLRFAEARLGRSVAEELRREAWLRILISKRVLLIDTPDYSKTDRRLMGPTSVR